MRKTKIVCTLGPSTDDEAVLRELILSGMNVARLNMSHGTHEEQKRRADMVKKLRKELDVPVAILLDTKGPEIRTGKFAEKVMLTHGQKYTLTTNERPGDADDARDAELARELMLNHARRLRVYRCQHCNFRSKTFFWRCPACGEWESFTPNRSEALAV